MRWWNKVPVSYNMHFHPGPWLLIFPYAYHCDPVRFTFVHIYIFCVKKPAEYLHKLNSPGHLTLLNASVIVPTLSHTHTHTSSLMSSESHDLRHLPAVCLDTHIHTHTHLRTQSHSYTPLLKFRLIHLGGPVCLAVVWGLDQRLDWQNTHNNKRKSVLCVCVRGRENEMWNLGVFSNVCVCASTA